MLKALLLAAIVVCLSPSVARDSGAPILFGIEASAHPCDIVVVSAIEPPIAKTKLKTKSNAKIKKKLPPKKHYAPGYHKPKDHKAKAPHDHKSKAPTKIPAHASSHLTTGPPCR